MWKIEMKNTKKRTQRYMVVSFSIKIQLTEVRLQRSLNTLKFATGSNR